MKSEELFDIIDGIDDDIILDIPEIVAEKPIKVVVKSSRTPFGLIAVSAACLLCVLGIGVFAAVLRSGLPVEPGSSDLISSENSSYDSDSNSSSSDSSETSDQNSDPEKENVLDQIRLGKDNLQGLNLFYATDGLECKTLLTVQPTNGYSQISGLYLTDTGPVILSSDRTLNYHYFWIDHEGNELDHVAFDVYNSRKEVIPDRDYPGTGVFGPFAVDGTWEVRYYQNGKLQKNVQVPKGYRSDFTPNQSQYLYIDEERKKLTLYDLETESVVKSLSVGDFGYGDSWVMAFVNVVTPKLATVTLFDYDTNEASEWHGAETLHTFLLELPTLSIIQQLPDSTELMALDDENFLMTKQNGKVRRISRAWLEDGRLVEEETNLILNEVSPYFNSNNIILSPEKKVALIREWETGDSYMRCRAVSTDTMQQIWEFRLQGGVTIPSGFYTAAAITDDAVLYLFGDTLIDDDDQPLYRISMKR